MVAELTRAEVERDNGTRRGKHVSPCVDWLVVDGVFMTLQTENLICKHYSLALATGARAR